jgi:hypothetical protein
VLSIKSGVVDVDAAMELQNADDEGSLRDETDNDSLKETNRKDPPV